MPAHSPSLCQGFINVKSEHAVWTRVDLESEGKVRESVVTNTDLSGDPFLDSLDQDAALHVFDETIDFSLEASVPDPVPFETKLRTLLDEHVDFLRPDQQPIVDRYHSMDLE